MISVEGYFSKPSKPLAYRKLGMPVKLQSLDIVVVGRFNPYIILPPWLYKHKICTDAEAKLVGRLEIGSQRAASHFEVDGLKWQVTDARLLVSSERVECNPAERVARVLALLPHTPVSAVGHNFHYRCDLSDWRGRWPCLGPVSKGNLEQYGMPIQVSYACNLELAELVFGLRVEQSRTSVEVHANLHREASDVDRVVTIASGLIDDIALSDRLISSICDEEVTK